MIEDLAADYEAAGFGARLAFGRRPALLVIDVVEAYLQKDSPLYAGVEDARDSNIRLGVRAPRRRAGDLHQRDLQRRRRRRRGVLP